MPLPWVEPFATALALRHEPGLVLLESMPGFGALGQRSFLAVRPSRVATDGLAALDQLDEGFWAGWLSYDLGRQIERLPTWAQDDLALPSLALGCYDAWLEFDHAQQAVLVRGGRASHLSAAVERARRDVSAPEHEAVALWESSLPRADYEHAVERAIDYIRAGDVFQVNLAQRLSAGWRGDPFALYARLRCTAAAPFMALARLGGADLISASPERFLRREGDLIETRPIKGTRPRGRSAAEDRAQAAALSASAKDRAENVMIVDLARNDLGRVARYGSVEVSRLCALERYAGVNHLVSEVRAQAAPGVRAAAVVRAAFPPGSVTGAPKIRAMEIVEELEPVRRGPYCGSVGWFRDGNFELSVAIRTFVLAGGRLNLHVGGAVVADSDPTVEWEETMHKGAPLLEAAGGELRAPSALATLS